MTDGFCRIHFAFMAFAAKPYSSLYSLMVMSVGLPAHQSPEITNRTTAQYRPDEHTYTQTLYSRTYSAEAVRALHTLKNSVLHLLQSTEPAVICTAPIFVNSLLYQSDQSPSVPSNAMLPLTMWMTFLGISASCFI